MTRPSLIIGMLLCPEFNAMAAQVFLDPFRAANYIHGESIYSWEYLSLEEGYVTASNGTTFETARTYTESETVFNVLVINTSYAPERFQSKTLQNWLGRLSRQGITIVGLDTGAFVMAFAGLLDGCRAAVHYEHREAFGELFPGIQVEQCLFISDRNRITCCGGLASADLALDMIHHNSGLDLANAAAQYIFMERARPGDEAQLPRAHEPLGYAVPERLRQAILLMERHLEDPLSLPEVARRLQVSQRQLERLFQQYTGVTPMRYYVNFRLDRARGLVTQTEMSIVEIASACGFSSAEHLSRAYKNRFALAPSKDRTEGRIPFQFRTFPRYAGV
ncbi:MAG: GlxA family transcriptional regulator [Gammaproteobacteria bacterium]